MAVIPSNNLPPDSQPWGRYVSGAITDLSLSASMMRNDIDNNQKTQAAQFNQLSEQLVDINQTLKYLTNGASTIGGTTQNVGSTSVVSGALYATATATKPIWATKYSCIAISNMEYYSTANPSPTVVIIGQTRINGDVLDLSTYTYGTVSGGTPSSYISASALSVANLRPITGNTVTVSNYVVSKYGGNGTNTGSYSVGTAGLILWYP